MSGYGDVVISGGEFVEHSGSTDGSLVNAVHRGSVQSETSAFAAMFRATQFATGCRV